MRYLEQIKSQPEQSFVSIIANFVAPVAEEIIQSLDQIRMRLILQLIKGISRLLRKLMKYFNRIAILTCFVLALLGVLPAVPVILLPWT